MNKRGRKSAAQLSVVVNPSCWNRTPPPEELNEHQAVIWRAVVDTEVAEFFGTAALRGMLMDYCRHVDAGGKVSQIIDGFKPEWLKVAEGAKRFADLLKMRDREVRAAATLATKLRLTNQSRYTPQAAATASRNVAKGSRPWDAQ